MSKRTPKSVKESCDTLWAKAVKHRAGHRCEHCGSRPSSPVAFHAHHVYGRTDHRMRFDLRNGCALCWTCHRWAEEMPLEFAAWFTSARPDDVPYLQDLRAMGVIHRDMAAYLSLEAELKWHLETDAVAPTPPVPGPGAPA